MHKLLWGIDKESRSREQGGQVALFGECLLNDWVVIAWQRERERKRRGRVRQSKIGIPMRRLPCHTPHCRHNYCITLTKRERCNLAVEVQQNVAVSIHNIVAFGALQVNKELYCPCLLDSETANTSLMRTDVHFNVLWSTCQDGALPEEHPSQQVNSVWRNKLYT